MQYSVLTGDFLLSKAIVALARLQNVKVVALMSRAVADFIEGNSRCLNAAAHGMPCARSASARYAFFQEAARVSQTRCSAAC